MAARDLSGQNPAICREEGAYRSRTGESLRTDGTTGNPCKTAGSADQLRLFNPETISRRRTGLRALESIRANENGGGWLYFVQSILGGPIKIGRAADPRGRLQMLQTGRVDQLVLISASPEAGHLERELHRLLAKARIRGEWFEEKAVLRFLGIKPNTAAMVRRAAAWTET